MIVDADEGSSESECFSVGSEDSWVNDASGRYDESCYYEYNAESDKDYGKYYLKMMTH